MATNRSQFELLLDRFDPVIRAAFLSAYDDIRSRVVLRLLVERLERGDVAGAIDVLGIERASFGALELALADAYNGGGMAFAAELKLRDPQGNRIAFQFGVRNLIAEARLRDHSSALVTRVTEDQIAALRIGLSEGLARGDNPTRTALDMVGRVSRVSRKREGGYLGLSMPQERTQAKARSALISGDLEGMRDYLQLKQRDKRFDRAIIKAIEAGKPLALADVDRVIGRLNDRQLKYRADKLALNETFGALNLAKNEAIRQAIESGKVDARDVTKTWGRTISEHPRSQHTQMVGQTVAFDQAFIAPDGTMIPFPHAPGLPARHTVGCNCPVSYKIDFTAALIRRRGMLV